MIQYVILEEHGVLSRDDLDALLQAERAARRASRLRTPGIAASTGSLGHGLGMATGQAYAEKLKNTDVLDLLRARPTASSRKARPGRP